MDGKRIQNYWSNEMQAMLDTYKQFQILIPAENRNGAAHNGEDGRYVETLIREYLKRYLPKDLEVLTGFILRPAVKTGLKNRSRKNEVDSHSTQLERPGLPPSWRVSMCAFELLVLAGASAGGHHHKQRSGCKILFHNVPVKINNMAAPARIAQNRLTSAKLQN